MPMTQEEAQGLVLMFTDRENPKAVGCPLHIADPLAGFRAGFTAFARAVAPLVTLDKPSVDKAVQNVGPDPGPNLPGYIAPPDPDVPEPETPTEKPVVAP